MVNINNSDKIDNLINSIHTQNLINKSAKKYIEYRKLKKFNLSKNRITEKDLPIQADIGSLFLINGNNIVEFYAYYDSCASVHIMHSLKRTLWIGTTNPINITKGDIYNLEYILENNEKIYYKDTYKYLITSLYNDGFDIYII